MLLLSPVPNRLTSVHVQPSSVLQSSFPPSFFRSPHFSVIFAAISGMVSLNFSIAVAIPPLIGSILTPSLSITITAIGLTPAPPPLPLPPPSSVSLVSPLPVPPPAAKPKPTLIKGINVVPSIVIGSPTTVLESRTFSISPSVVLTSFSTSSIFQCTSKFFYLQCKNIIPRSRNKPERADCSMLGMFTIPIGYRLPVLLPMCGHEASDGFHQGRVVIR